MRAKSVFLDWTEGQDIQILLIRSNFARLTEMNSFLERF